jgi:hypothetical protein
MARCRCAEGACGCALVAGDNTTVTGTGTPRDPWVVGASAIGYLSVADTSTIDLELQGDGTNTNPHLLTASLVAGAAVSVQFQNTPEVNFATTGGGTIADPMVVSADLPLLTLTGGSAGQVLTQDGNGVFIPMPATTAPIGAVASGFGITGDGSAVAPLRINLCNYDQLKAACAP